LLVDNLAASLPVGSRLTILSSAPDQVSAQLRPIDGSAPTEATRTSETSATATASASAASSLDVTVEEDAVLHIDAGGAQIEIPIISILDEPPAIQFEEEPSTTPAGAMVLSYIAADDYGIMQAQAVIERADLADGEATDAPREEPLIAAPSFDLTLPSGVGGSVSMTRDLTAHPWAGARVELSLQAADGREQIGRSRTLTIDLPARPFSDPLALGVAEQRRILALDPRQRTSVLTMLEAFALGPELFMEDDYSTFLGLTVTTQRLRLADTRDELIEIVDMLWQLALTIQDGDLAAAAERLRQAEQALADALENGASDEEIAQLMDELRNALQDYMQGLAQQMQGLDPSQLNQQLSTQSLDPQSMQSMMDQIEQLSQMGAEDAARQMLDQLRQQLDALRGAQAMQPREPTPEEQELREALQQLQSITREQQRLMDETFPFSQDAQAPQLRRPFDRLTPNPDTNPGERDMGRGPDRPAEENSEGGEQGSDPQNPLDGLSAEQQALREQLEALMDQLSDLGLDPSQMGEAGDAMDGAGQMLGRGSAQGALPEQGRALEALRQGAQDLAQQLAGDGDGQGQGEGQAQGQGQSPGQQGGMPRLLFAPGQGQQGFDPLGRPQRAPRAQSGERVGIPEESDIQRARDILNEIQRRLGERSRPQPELDYLDRLIERF
ncbi:MAG: TIGR02302 family protein, partial [Devosiaceae bacterium]|nr:TIGR02302 family protein [Devosiaceae bacterium MH13]